MVYCSHDGFSRLFTGFSLSFGVDGLAVKVGSCQSPSLYFISRKSRRLNTAFYKNPCWTQGSLHLYFFLLLFWFYRNKEYWKSKFNKYTHLNMKHFRWRETTYSLISLNRRLTEIPRTVRVAVALVLCLTTNRISFSIRIVYFNQW